MHLEILSKKQQDLLPFVAQFKRNFYLVGGTAIALHIGHRRSIDFDLFSFGKINRMRIRQKISETRFKHNLIFEDIDQIHFVLNEVKLTFFQYPYEIEHQTKLENIITMPSLLSLAAMKAFALGRRAKWKDYVDLYFILRNFFSIEEIMCEAKRLFGENLVSEKLFREQLAFHKDIDYREEVEYLIPNPPNDDEIRNVLIEISVNEFVN